MTEVYGICLTGYRQGYCMDGLFTPKRTLQITPAGQFPVRTSSIHILERIQAGRIKRQFGNSQNLRPVTASVFQPHRHWNQTLESDTGNKLWLQRSVSEPGCSFSIQHAASIPRPCRQLLAKHTNKPFPRGSSVLTVAAPSRPRPRPAPPHHGGRAPHGGHASRSLPQQRPGGPERGSANQRRACCGAGGSGRWWREAARLGRGGCGPGARRGGG